MLPRITKAKKSARGARSSKPARKATRAPARKPAKAKRRLTREQLRRTLREYSTRELGAMLRDAARDHAAASGTARSLRTTSTALRSKFDAAQSNDHNRRHWAGADGLSANAAANPYVRNILRQRSRYEVANNSYARGLLLTLANDTIGRGPRLQLLTGEGNDGITLSREDARRVERSFAAWSKQVRLAAKLRLMRMAKVEDGEAFAIKVTNEAVRHRVKLDVQLIEADQVATPDLWRVGEDRHSVDGIRFDPSGNPIEYHVLKDHPGTDKYSANPLDYDKVRADGVVHWFRQDRPGQSRGIPEIAAALPLFSALRRFTLAVVATAEKAAAIAGVLETDAPVGEQDELDAFEAVDLNVSELLTMPQGWKLNQYRSEQPTTTYGMFKSELLGEIGRCVLSPYAITSGSSASYNYASGRLDHQIYDVGLGVEREDCEAVVLDNLLADWLEEAVLIDGLLPQALRSVGALDELPPHRWFWDGRPHIDPEKEARAQATRLQNHTSTLSSEYASQGKDWEEELEQRGRELARMQELGIPIASAHDNTGKPLGEPGSAKPDTDTDPADEPASAPREEARR